jgi:Zn-dependent protease
MFKSWRLGHVFGFPVEINFSFILLLALVYLAFGGLAGVIVVGLAFGSVLLHELGHALVARRLGVHVSGIELSFFGGAAKMVQMPRKADHEIAIAAAGPAVSLMLGGIGLGLGMLLHAGLLLEIGWINFVLAGFNLIPALPMDGGRILRALLTKRMDFVRATDIAVQVSRAAAIGFAILGLWGLFAGAATYQLLVLAPLLWMMGTRERLLARSSPGPFASYGGFGESRRGHRPTGSWYEAPFEESSRPYGFHREVPYSGLPIRRFTVRQVGGRMVIEPLD